MKFDQENLYFDAKATIATSDVIANVGGGDAVNPLFLVIHSDAKETSSLTFALQTSDDESFATNTVLATYATPANGTGLLVRDKVPYGMKAFSRLVGTGTPKGKITAGLVEDVPNWYK